MSPFFWIVLGLLIGWLVEWLIDRYIWRRKYQELEDENLQLRTELTKLRVEYEFEANEQNASKNKGRKKKETSN
jgi:hypothetical protein